MNAEPYDSIIIGAGHNGLICATYLAKRGQRVLVRQIAGLIARRIVTYPEQGGQVERGERIGLFRFGSRVDLFMPLGWSLDCAVGDKVAGGSTVLARTSGPEEAP